jgi:hypothetical protein
MARLAYAYGVVGFRRGSGTLWSDEIESEQPEALGARDRVRTRVDIEFDEKRASRTTSLSQP